MCVAYTLLLCLVTFPFVQLFALTLLLVGYACFLCITGTQAGQLWGGGGMLAGKFVTGAAVLAKFVLVH